MYYFVKFVCSFSHSFTHLAKTNSIEFQIYFEYKMQANCMLFIGWRKHSGHLWMRYVPKFNWRKWNYEFISFHGLTYKVRPWIGFPRVRSRAPSERVCVCSVWDVGCIQNHIETNLKSDCNCPTGFARCTKNAFEAQLQFTIENKS